MANQKLITFAVNEELICQSVHSVTVPRTPSDRM